MKVTWHASMAEPLPPVETLSDDDGGEVAGLPLVAALSDDEPSRPEHQVAVQQKRRRKSEGPGFADVEKRLKILVQSNCKCRGGGCKKPFRGGQAFEDILQMRYRFSHSIKQDVDTEVLVSKIICLLLRVSLTVPKNHRQLAVAEAPHSGFPNVEAAGTSTETRPAAGWA